MLTGIIGLVAWLAIVIFITVKERWNQETWTEDEKGIVQWASELGEDKPPPFREKKDMDDEEAS
jgi:hypothetical protein